MQSALSTTTGSSRAVRPYTVALQGARSRRVDARRAQPASHPRPVHLPTHRPPRRVDAQPGEQPLAVLEHGPRLVVCEQTEIERGEGALADAADSRCKLDAERCRCASRRWSRAGVTSTPLVSDQRSRAASSSSSRVASSAVELSAPSTPSSTRPTAGDSGQPEIVPDLARLWPPGRGVDSREKCSHRTRAPR